MIMNNFMQFKVPQNTEKYQWTEHSKHKMRQYGLSPQRILRVVRNPKRTEEGIVEKTIAVMQPTSMKTNKEGKRTWSQEIWVMYQLRGSGTSSKLQKTRNKQIQNSKFQKTNKNSQIQKLIENSKFKIQNSANRKIRIISAWRYPGISPKNEPIPEDIIREIENIL